MANEDYIAVSGDDWYQRRRQDAEGEFFRKVADQGPRKGAGGSTRQGIYCFTADGELLAYKNAGQDADVMREVFRAGLVKWNKLPAERRRPGAVKVENPGKTDARYTRTLPPGGANVTVFTRILDNDAQGQFCKGTCETLGGDRAARDHLWLTAVDIQSLLAGATRPGVSFAMPSNIAARIARFHLLDNTRGEPPAWQQNEIRANEMTLTVETVTTDKVIMRLTGAVLLADQANASTAKRGFEVRLLGHIAIDRQKKSLVRFDVVAVGDHWGEATFTRNARPGRKPLGVAFELASDSPLDKVPPQFSREWNAYMGR